MLQTMNRHPMCATPARLDCLPRSLAGSSLEGGLGTRGISSVVHSSPALPASTDRLKAPLAGHHLEDFVQVQLGLLRRKRGSRWSWDRMLGAMGQGLPVSVPGSAGDLAHTAYTVNQFKGSFYSRGAGLSQDSQECEK